MKHRLSRDAECDVRLFISEFVCGGEWPDVDWDGGLAAEGRGMLLALLRDAIRIPELEVSVLWDRRLQHIEFPGVHVIRPDSSAEASELFEERIAWSDSTLLIAPEFDGLLTHRALLVEGIGSRLCGPNPVAIAQCSDKLLLAEILSEAGIRNVPTFEFRVEQSVASEIQFPAVIKPRDGAGSQATYLVRSAAEFAQLQPRWAKSSLLRQAIWQPYVAGRAVSVGVLITPEQYRYEAMPVCDQRLSDDGRFQYLGGILPAHGVDSTRVQDAAVAACRAVPGLRGFVGVDLIVPDHVSEVAQDDVPGTPLVVEINPRLTTSYQAYSQQCEQNLLERWLNPDAEVRELSWKSGRIRYEPDGQCFGLDLMRV